MPNRSYYGRNPQQPAYGFHNNTKNDGTLQPANATSTRRPKKPTLPALPIPHVDVCAGRVILANLIAIWRQNQKDRNAELSKRIQKALDDAPNPYALGLFLTSNSPDFLAVKESKEASLSFSIITELNSWLMKSDLDVQAKKSLRPDLQVVAFEMFTTQKNPNLLKMAFIIYRLDIMKDKLIARIKEMCREKRFKEACVCAGTLDLHSSFTIHDFIIPLIFQSRETFAEEFLSGSKERQSEFLQFLDGLLARRNLETVIEDYISTHRIPDVKMEKLYSKPLEKLLKRLSAKFQADPNTCPNARRKQRYGALHHLMYRKYSEEAEMSEESFVEMLEQIVGDDINLQEDAMQRMRIKGDKVAAANFALRLSIPLTKISNEVLEVMHQLNSNIVPNPLCRTHRQVAVEENWEDDAPKSTKSIKLDSSAKVTSSTKDAPNIAIEKKQQRKKCYVFPLSEVDIIIVKTPEDMKEFIKYVEEQVREVVEPQNVVVGFDAEWNPAFPAFTGAALLQLAFKLKVFLIDVVQLKGYKTKENSTGNNQTTNFWTDFKVSFFENKRIIKASYDIKNDLKMLGETVPEWKNIKSEFKSCLDLCVLEKEILRKNCSFFPHIGESSNDSGLSELVRLCLGSPLNKDEQMSNWEHRPLRQSQILYASTDVYCLLDLFNFLITCKKTNPDMSENIHKFIAEQLKKGSNEATERSRKKPAPITFTKKALVMSADSNGSDCGLPFQIKQPAKDIKFVCDNMLQGLGKKLRACGLDTRIITGFESHDMGVYYATAENRYLLTKGATYDQIVNCLPPNQAYKVNFESFEEQLREIINHFNIIVTPEDLFSRCQRCNTVKFIQIAGTTMADVLKDLNLRIKKKFTDSEKTLTENSKSQAIEGMITCFGLNGQTSAKRWELHTPRTVSLENGTLKTPSKAIVEVTKIPFQYLESIQNFYVCDCCGKCYWDSLELEKQLFQL